MYKLPGRDEETLAQKWNTIGPILLNKIINWIRNSDEFWLTYFSITYAIGNKYVHQNSHPTTIRDVLLQTFWITFCAMKSYEYHIGTYIDPITILSFCSKVITKLFFKELISLHYTMISTLLSVQEGLDCFD